MDHFRISTANFYMNFFTAGYQDSAKEETSNTFLRDYYALKNGSYKKLLTSYYKKVESGSIPLDTTQSIMNTAQAGIKQDAEALKQAANALSESGKNSVFRRKAIETIDPQTGQKSVNMDYDKEAVANAVKNFASQYNNLIDSVVGSDQISILKNAVRMTKTTKVNRLLLRQAGINVTGDNHLTVDEEKLKQADSSVLKSLFHGSFSYADKIAGKAQKISSESGFVFTRSQNSYQQDGTYVAMNSGDLWSSFV